MEENILYGRPLNFSREPLGRFLYRKLKSHKNKIAQIDRVSNQHITFSHILKSSCALADNLIRKGYKPGDIVTIFSENRLEYYIPTVATIFIGVACSPINPTYTSDELLYDTNITKPKGIFCTKKSLPTVCEAIKKGLIVEELIIFDDSVPDELLNKVNCKYSYYADLVKSSDPAFNVDDFVPYDLNPKQQTAVVLRSSGTSGFPKSVKLSCENLSAFIEAAGHLDTFGFTKDDIVLAVLPFFHGYGLTIVICSLMYGYTMIVLERFDERLFLSSIEEYKVNVLPMVPPLLVFLAKHPLVSNYDLSSVKRVITGSAPVGEGTLRELQNRLGFLVRQGYGMTELTLVACMTPPDVFKPKSVGRVLRGIDAKVIDLKTGKAVGPNVHGELCFHSPFMMQGYLNNDKATREIIDKDGWLHTGDVGYYDEEHYFYIVDRIKELIKYKGYQVPPALLEALIITHPGVKEVAVIGRPDEAAGELPTAIIVKQPGSTISENDVVQFVAGKVSPSMKLRGGVKFVDEIPKTASGKILRRLIRDSLKAKL